MYSNYPSGHRKQYVFHPAKIGRYLIFFTFLLFTCFQFSFAQNRPNINTLNVDVTLTTAQEQAELALAIKTFVDNEHWFLELHETPFIHTSGFAIAGPCGGPNCAQTSVNFLPWHRYFITILEQHLTSVGLSKYVPLPKWDPTTTIPAAFFNGPNARANNIPGHWGTPQTQCPNCSNAATADLIFCPLVNSNITTHTLWTTNPTSTNGVRCNTSCISTQNFYTNIATNMCNWNTVTDMGNAFGGAAGHHGNVHVAIGGAMGGCFHAAPGAMIFYLWHAYIDDVWKQWECTCGKAQGVTGVDLYMKDKFTGSLPPPMLDGFDEGYEPFMSSVPLYESEDIWVRITNDGLANQEHQDPDYSSTNPNYVYVRVRNRGCQTSSGTEELKIYFSKQSTGLNWNPSGGTSDWVNNGTLGDLIGTVTVDPLAPGAIAIYEFQWYPPNPAAYTPPETESHVCLLARIENTPSAPFGMTVTETNTIWYNVRENNNIVWKNTKVVNTPINGLLRVGNPCDNDATINFTFDVPAEAQADIYRDAGDYVNGSNVVYVGPQEMFTDNGIVTVNLGQEVYERWAAAGREGEGINAEFYTRTADDGTPREYPLRYLVGDAAPYTIAIMGPNATLNNIHFSPQERQNFHVQFHYLTQPQADARLEFDYRIGQLAVNSHPCEGLGGNQYKIKRPTCPKPDAGPDVTIGPGCLAILNANPVVSGATYTWFNNSSGAYVGSGPTINVSPLTTTTYEVQVVMPNGCVGYDLVKVIVDPALTPCNWCFHDLRAFPNPPSTGQLTVAMITDVPTDVSVKFLNVMGQIFYDKIHTTQGGENQFNITTNGLPSGTYKLHVKCQSGPGEEVQTITIQ